MKDKIVQGILNSGFVAGHLADVVADSILKEFGVRELNKEDIVDDPNGRVKYRFRCTSALPIAQPYTTPSPNALNVDLDPRTAATIRNWKSYPERCTVTLPKGSRIQSVSIPRVFGPKAASVLREGTLRPVAPDPGFWVRYAGYKFSGRTNFVVIEGHETFRFYTYGIVKLLQSYPFGVRADDDLGNSYFITGGPDPIHMYMFFLTPGDVAQLDSGKPFYIPCKSSVRRTNGDKS